MGQLKKIFKIGSSYAITIPSDFIKYYTLEIGEYIEVEFKIPEKQTENKKSKDKEDKSDKKFEEAVSFNRALLNSGILRKMEID